MGKKVDKDERRLFFAHSLLSEAVCTLSERARDYITTQQQQGAAVNVDALVVETLVRVLGIEEQKAHALVHRSSQQTKSADRLTLIRLAAVATLDRERFEKLEAEWGIRVQVHDIEGVWWGE